eukprot:gene37656-45743_t
MESEMERLHAMKYSKPLYPFNKERYFSVEIVIKEDGNFLDLTGVPDQLKLRSGLRKYLYRRDCYDDFIKDICHGSIARQSPFWVLPASARMLLDDPGQFGLATRSFYFQTRQDKIRLYHHDSGGAYSICFVPPDEELDKSIILFADMETADGSPTEHAGISFIFTSFRPSRFKEITKNGWNKVMPTWSADEQAEHFNSTQFESEYSKEVAKR